jgi:hypothetical protein
MRLIFAKGSGDTKQNENVFGRALWGWIMGNSSKPSQLRGAVRTSRLFNRMQINVAATLTLSYLIRTVFTSSH